MPVVGLDKRVSRQWPKARRNGDYLMDITDDTGDHEGARQAFWVLKDVHIIVVLDLRRNAFVNLERKAIRRP